VQPTKTYVCGFSNDIVGAVGSIAAEAKQREHEVIHMFRGLSASGATIRFCLLMHVCKGLHS